MTNQRKVLIGFSLALTVALTGGFLLLVVSISALRARSLWAVAAFALLGLVFLLLGCFQSGDADAAEQKALAPPVTAEEHPLSFFRKLRYWGCMLVLSAVPMFFLSQRLSKPLAVAAKPTPKSKVEEVIPVPAKTAKPVVTAPFPQLTVKGLICNGPQSTALVNDRTVKLGERIEGVTVVAIERWGITVQMGDREKHFTLQP